jgi:hypothetical protein
MKLSDVVDPTVAREFGIGSRASPCLVMTAAHPCRDGSTDASIERASDDVQ